MDSLARLGLEAHDLSEPVESDEQLIQEVMSSGRLYHKAMNHVILDLLREHFKNKNLQKSDGILQFFPKKGRRSSWEKFQTTFELSVPDLGWTWAAIAFMIICGLVALYYILYFTISGLGSLSPLEAIILSPHLGDIAYIALVTLAIPLGIIAFVLQRKLPGRGTVADLAEAILDHNIRTFLSDDKIGLKIILEDQIKKPHTVGPL